MINRYEVANAIAGQQAEGVYEALKAALTPPPAEKSQQQQQALLQLEGSPVYVNPESMLESNQMASASLSLPMQIGPDEVSVAQKKVLKDIDDKEMKDSVKDFEKKLADFKQKNKI